MMKNYKVYPENSSYLAGADGLVYSIKYKRNVGSDREDGYRKVWMNGGWNNIHDIVYHTWVGEIPEGFEIIHKDYNKHNNSIDNLEAATHQESLLHASNNPNLTYPTGKGHWNYQRTVSDETKLKMSEAKKGANHPKFKGFYVVRNIRYVTPHEPAEKLGVSARTIARRCKANKNGFSFEYLEDVLSSGSK